MRLAIHQPNFLPRLKVLQKLANADCWVVLDNVQYAHREWQNRARIAPLNKAQRNFWLTLPVLRRLGQTTPIGQVEIVDLPRAIGSCRASLMHSFHRGPYWDDLARYWGGVEAGMHGKSLIEFALLTSKTALTEFARLPDITLASDLQVRGNKSGLMAAICSEMGATEYLADSGARSYLKSEHFSNTKVLWQHWVEPAGAEGITWRDISFVNFLARRGPGQLREHLLLNTFEEIV